VPATGWHCGRVGPCFLARICVIPSRNRPSDSTTHGRERPMLGAANSIHRDADFEMGERKRMGSIAAVDETNGRKFFLDDPTTSSPVRKSCSC
jgi:hypothetical protein